MVVVKRQNPVERQYPPFMKHTPSRPAAPKASRRNASLVVTALIALLLLANLFIIFRFSAANGVESGKMSAGVTRYLLEHLYPDYTELSPAEQASILGQSHKFVRKAAHFSEFALLGFLTAGLLLWVSHRFLPMKPLATWLIPAAFTLLYAASDEIHQIFTNRGPRVTDVLIDFAGALFGILLIHCAVWLVSACRRGKHTPKKSRAGRRKTRA